jgi:hypothetical protein
VRARFSAWADTGDSGEEWSQDTEDVSAWLELPPDFRAPDDDSAAYRNSSKFDLSLADDEFDDAKWSVYEVHE